MDEYKTNTLYIFCGFLVGALIGLAIAYRWLEMKHKVNDTDINRIELDSLKNDASKRNLIIIELNKQAQDEIKKVSELNDSDAVDVFLKLTSR